MGLGSLPEAEDKLLTLHTSTSQLQRRVVQFQAGVRDVELGGGCCIAAVLQRRILDLEQVV